MFFKFASWNNGEPIHPGPSVTAIEMLSKTHPQVLLNALEYYYSGRAPNPSIPDYRLPSPPNVSTDAPLLHAGIQGALAPIPDIWHHLIYAYAIENTRIFEIFDRVVREFEAGERFETPDMETALWLRTTEALFYRDLGSGFIGSLTSSIRPDLRGIRRNTYFRLLGLDLNHGMDGNRPYQFDKPTASNREFVPIFEALLREVWRGVVNSANLIGPNDADNAAIADHARRLREMQNVRRNNGNLRREEFWAVAAMSWFHLAVAEDTPVVRAMKAEAESPAERLTKIGERVGIPAHRRCDAFFNMAAELSSVLTFIETNPFAVQPTHAGGYYLPGGPFPQLASDMRAIITYWSEATGRDIKSQRMLLPGTSTPLPPQGRGALALRA